MKFLVQQEELRLHKADSVSLKILIFSLLSVVALVVIAIIQTSYIKSFFRNKKLI